MATAAPPDLGREKVAIRVVRVLRTLEGHVEVVLRGRRPQVHIVVNEKVTLNGVELVWPVHDCALAVPATCTTYVVCELYGTLP
jgi:hypothetical protein